MTGEKKDPKTTKTEKKKAVKKEEQASVDGSSSPEDSETNSDDEQQNEGKNERNVNKNDDNKRDQKIITDQTDGKRKNNGNNINIICFVIVLIPILGVLISTSSKDSVTVDIELGLRELANDYQNQSQFSYKKLKSRMTSYIHHKTSPQPFVLMVASTPDNQRTAECFANRIAKLLTTVTVIINGSKYFDAPSDDAKQDIDLLLRDVFGERKFPTAAIIHNFDSIPYGTTSLFYAYCDHDNPMYKEAAIIFTISLPQNYEISSNEVDREGLVGKYLSEESPWVNDKEFSMDVVGALISRITDTIIVVNKERKEALENSC